MPTRGNPFLNRTLSVISGLLPKTKFLGVHQRLVRVISALVVKPHLNGYILWCQLIIKDTGWLSDVVFMISGLILSKS